jgi:acyl carrier protein
MNLPDVYTRLQQVFDDVFLSPVKVSPQLSARDVPEWDSLLHISLVTMVEETFGIRFRMGEVEATQNIGQLAELIQRRQMQDQSARGH